MSEPTQGPVLDYASPAVRGPMRLTDKSILTFVPIADGVKIVESLQGKVPAIAAIVFTSSTVSLLGGLVVGGSIGGAVSLAGLLLYVAFVGLTLAVIFGVINENWRATILSVSPQSVTLDFKTPFRLTRRQWTQEQFNRVRVVQQLDPRTKRLVHEIQLDFWSQPTVRLFTGHDPPELNEIATTIKTRFSPGQS